MKTTGSLRRGQRRGAHSESMLGVLLAIASMTMAACYALGLVFIVVRGGWRVAAFTTIATPLVGIEGEDSMRFVVGAAISWTLAWSAVAMVRFVLGRYFVWTTAVERVAQLATLGFAIAFAVTLRDHLPRFLIGLPSEIRAGGGIGPEIFNTVYFAFLSTAMTLPVGVGAALYLARFARQRRFVAVLRVALDTLASLPSIVYGLFGFLVFVVELHMGYSLFAGALVLAILNLPLVVSISEESLQAVPRELEEASLALGATRIQTALRISLPYAWPGILSALVLSIGRVLAETAPLIMTAGTTVSRGNAYSLDPFRGGETLAVHLWYVNSAGLAPDRAEVSASTAATLVALIVLVNMLAARLGRVGPPRRARARGEKRIHAKT